jgi:hypothetical protein
LIASLMQKTRPRGRVFCATLKARYPKSRDDQVRNERIDCLFFGSKPSSSDEKRLEPFCWRID